MAVRLSAPRTSCTLLLRNLFFLMFPVLIYCLHLHGRTSRAGKGVCDIGPGGKGAGETGPFRLSPYQWLVLSSNQFLPSRPYILGRPPYAAHSSQNVMYEEGGFPRNVATYMLYISRNSNFIIKSPWGSQKAGNGNEHTYLQRRWIFLIRLAVRWGIRQIRSSENQFISTLLLVNIFLFPRAVLQQLIFAQNWTCFFKTIFWSLHKTLPAESPYDWHDNQSILICFRYIALVLTGGAPIIESALCSLSIRTCIHRQGVGPTDGPCTVTFSDLLCVDQNIGWAITPQNMHRAYLHQVLPQTMWNIITNSHSLNHKRTLKLLRIE
jgi:hypothetical protein